MKVNWAMMSYCIAAGDPLEVLIRYTKSKNLRLVDLFAMIDNDKSGSVSRQELIHGVTVRISLILHDPIPKWIYYGCKKIEHFRECRLLHVSVSMPMDSISVVIDIQIDSTVSYLAQSS